MEKISEYNLPMNSNKMSDTDYYFNVKNDDATSCYFSLHYHKYHTLFFLSHRLKSHMQR